MGLVSVGGGQRGPPGLLVAGAQVGHLAHLGVRAETGVGRLGSQWLAGVAGVLAHQPAGGVSLAAPVLRHPQSLVERQPLVVLHGVHLLDVDLGGAPGTRSGCWARRRTASHLNIIIIPGLVVLVVVVMLPVLSVLGERWLPWDLTMWASPGCRGDIGSDLTARLGLTL